MFEQDEITPDFTEAIFRETEGNPFFIEEVVKALIDSGQIYRENMEWQRKEVADLAIPQSIREAIGRRLNRLSSESIAVLQYAAVLGKVFNFQELMMIYENGSGEVYERENYLINALDDGLNAQLIRGLEGETFSFTHDKIRETLYEDMNSIRRRRLHQKLAQAMEKAFKETSIENHLPDLAYHYLQGGELQKGLQYSIQAGVHSRKLYANEEALNYYFQAAEAAESLDLDDELSVNVETIGDLHQAQGFSLEAVENYNEAISLVDKDDQIARLKMKIGVSYANVGDVRGLEYLRAAERELDPGNQLEELANVLSWIGRFYHYRAQHRQAITSFMDALEMIEKSDLYPVKCTLYAFLSGAYQHLLEYEQSMKWAHECLSLGEKYDDPYWIAVGHEFISEDLMFTGDWKRAIDHAIQDNKLGEKIGSLERIAWSKLCQAEPLYGHGRLKEALVIGQSGLELAEQIGERRLSTLLLALLSKVSADLDDDELAESYARQSIQQADDLNQVFMQCRSRFSLIYLLVKNQEWEEAYKLTNDGREIYLPTENVFGQSEIQIITPLVLLGSGQVTEAKNASEEILELAANHKIIQYHGISLRIRGQILTDSGELDQAKSDFHQAIEILSGLGSQVDLGRTYFHRGKLEVLRENLDAARDDFNKAKQLFIDCDAKHDLQLADGLLASIS
jgi:tetratricopeptide (TPR) repeat protein